MTHAGKRDEIVPHKMMQELFTSCELRDKHMTVFPQGRHNETPMEDGYMDAWKQYMQKFA